MAGIQGQKVRVHTVATKLLLQTTGIDANEVILDLPPGPMAEYGPYLSAVTGHLQTEARTAQFQWKLTCQWSLDGVNWSAAADVFTWVTSSTPTITVPFTDAAKMGLKMRYSLACKPMSGTAREQGMVTLALAFEFKS